MTANKSAVTRQMQRRRLPASIVPCAATIMIAVLAMSVTPCLGINMPPPPASEEATAAQHFAGAARESSMTQRSSPTQTSSTLLGGDHDSLMRQEPTTEEISIAYDLRNDCGNLDAAIAMEDGDALKQGLIEATTAITNGILEEEFGDERRHSKRNIEKPRVHLADGEPVSIDKMFTMNGRSGILKVYSTINVEVEMPEGEVVTRAVRFSIRSLIRRSIYESQRDGDGSFFRAVPLGAGLCPES